MALNQNSVDETLEWESLIKSLSEQKPLLGVYLKEGRLEQKEPDVYILKFLPDKTFFVDALMGDQDLLTREFAKRFNGAKFSIAVDLISPVIDNEKKIKDDALYDDPMVKKTLNAFKGWITEVK